MTRWLPLFLLAVLAAACTNASPPATPVSPATVLSNDPVSDPLTDHSVGNDPLESAPLLVSPSPDPSPTVPPTPAPLPNQTHYTLSATLDYAAKQLTVAQTIAYYNDTGQPLDELLLVVEPNWTAGVFQLDQIIWEDGVPLENWNLNANLLRFPLRDPLPPAGELTLSISYRLILPAQAGILGFDWRGINLGNWYPFIPPYRESTGWLAYQRGWVGESFSHALAGYAVEITLLNPPPGVVIAASAPTQQETAFGQNADTYRFRLPRARSFALAISPEYTVFSTSVGEVEVLSYAFPETLAAGERALQVTAEALALYEELFGPYPHPTMSVAQVSFPDGMEFDGLYFLSEQYYWGYPIEPDRLTAAQNYLTIIAAHETSHQWWYALLGNDQAIEPWLDETLAAYTELIFYERTYPELVEWWWSFRVDEYDPRDCCVGDTIYQYGNPRAYINAVYLRGAYFVQDLRVLMGDDAFFAALKTYAERYRGGFVTAQDFWAVIGEYTQKDLTPLRLQYFGGS